MSQKLEFKKAESSENIIFRPALLTGSYVADTTSSLEYVYFAFSWLLYNYCSDCIKKISFNSVKLFAKDSQPTDNIDTTSKQNWNLDHLQRHWSEHHQSLGCNGVFVFAILTSNIQVTPVTKPDANKQKKNNFIDHRIYTSSILLSLLNHFMFQCRNFTAFQIESQKSLLTIGNGDAICLYFSFECLPMIAENALPELITEFGDKSSRLSANPSSLTSLEFNLGCNVFKDHIQTQMKDLINEITNYRSSQAEATLNQLHDENEIEKRINDFASKMGVLPETVTKPLASFVKNKEFKNALTSIVDTASPPLLVKPILKYLISKL